jgi:uncharacterized UBP type Zn finger protein
VSDAPICSHLDTIAVATGNTTGCEDCMRMGGHWVHLRRCTECGHVGCCDDSPNRHATAHNASSEHPLIQSFEPGEDWIYCYTDDVMFEIESMLDSPSHP